MPSHFGTRTRSPILASRETTSSPGSIVKDRDYLADNLCCGRLSELGQVVNHKTWLGDVMVETFRESFLDRVRAQRIVGLAFEQEPGEGDFVETTGHLGTRPRGTFRV